MSPLKDPVVGYKNLNGKEKERIGEALVKVNMGVASPSEQRLIAGFLKGSAYISKPGVLDELIALIGKADREEVKSDKTGTVLLKK